VPAEYKGKALVAKLRFAEDAPFKIEKKEGEVTP